jgi:hypothetical protein
MHWTERAGISGFDEANLPSFLQTETCLKAVKPPLLPSCTDYAQHSSCLKFSESNVRNKEIHWVKASPREFACMTLQPSQCRRCGLGNLPSVVHNNDCFLKRARAILQLGNGIQGQVRSELDGVAGETESYTR